MSNVIELEVMPTRVYDEFDLGVEINIGDLEQPIITAEKNMGYQMINGNWQTIKEPRKFKVEYITYSFHSYQNTDEFRISSVRGYFFKKDKRLGTKFEHINLDNLEPKDFNAIASQIPDKFNEIAKERLNEISQRLNKVISNGVITNA